MCGWSWGELRKHPGLAPDTRNGVPSGEAYADRERNTVLTGQAEVEGRRAMAEGYTQDERASAWENDDPSGT